MKFKGKCGIVLWLTLVFVLGCAACFVSQKNGFDSQAVFWILIVIYAAISIILVLFMVRNYIIVTDDEIKICLGFSTTALKTASIVSMRKVINFVASGGASAKRIEVIFTRDGDRNLIYISPKEADSFIELVCGYNQNIKVHGN